MVVIKILNAMCMCYDVSASCLYKLCVDMLWMLGSHSYVKRFEEEKLCSYNYLASLKL